MFQINYLCLIYNLNILTINKKPQNFAFYFFIYKKSHKTLPFTFSFIKKNHKNIYYNSLNFYLNWPFESLHHKIITKKKKKYIYKN